MSRSSSVKHRAAQARIEFRDFIAQYPWPYLPLARLAHPAWSSPEPVRSRTELVIEGFPRSGNTFAVAAFRMSQAEPVRIAHHLHAPAQIIEAVKKSIPAVLLVREPDAAVTSLVIRDSRITLEMGLRKYVRFHQRLLPWRHSYITVTFETATADLGSAIEAVNERWGTGFFSRLDNSEEGVRRCLEAVELSERRKYAKSAYLEALIAVPSEAREAVYAGVVEELNHPELASIRGSAHRLYEEYLREAI